MNGIDEWINGSFKINKTSSFNVLVVAVDVDSFVIRKKSYKWV